MEYGRNQEKDTKWAIKSLDLKNNQEKILYSGISSDHIEPPVLRVFENQVSWIEKRSKNILYIALRSYINQLQMS